MSPIDFESVAVGSTGWALFDWTYSADRPTFAFVAGCCNGARVELDRYRRGILLIGTQTHLTAFAWSTKLFEFIHNNPAGIGSPDVINEPEQRPQTVTHDATINALREFRTPTNSFQNRVTQASPTYQNAAFALTHHFTGNDISPTFRWKAWIAQNPADTAPVRLLLVGHHNNAFGMGAAFP